MYIAGIFYPMATCITALAFSQSAVVSRAVLKLESKYKLCNLPAENLILKVARYSFQQIQEYYII